MFYRRRLLFHGMVLFLIGLLTGLAEQHFANVRMALAAHLEDNEAFDAAGTMDAIYNALITQPTNRPSVVALQLAAVAAYASLHSSKGEPPELDEAIDFADFQKMVDNLVAATAPIVPRKHIGALKCGQKLTRAGLLTRYQSFLVQELETISWKLYGERDLAKHYSSV